MNAVSLKQNILEYERRQAELRRKIREKTEEKERAVRVHMKNEQHKNDLAEEVSRTLSRLLGQLRAVAFCGGSS